MEITFMQTSVQKTHRTGAPCLETRSDRHSFDIIALFSEFCSWYSRFLVGGDLQVTTEISTKTPQYFKGNYSLIKHLLFETGKNSLLYVGAGKADLELKAEHLTGCLYTIYFTITLFGNCIPLDKEKELFQSASAETERDSFRLRCTNLYYARMIARGFGGDIRILSDAGFGSRYLVEVHLVNIPA